MADTLTGGPAPQMQIPRSEEVKQWFYTNAITGETERFRRLDRYEAVWRTTHYLHLKQDWWGMTADQMETISPSVQVPAGFEQPAINMSVRMKRPTAPFNLGMAINKRFTGLLFSQARRPVVEVEGDEDTQDYLQACMQQMRFFSKMTAARNMGGGTGTVLVTCHLRDGKFSLEVHNTKHCQVLWKDKRTQTPLAVLKLYRYPVEEVEIDDKGNQRGTRVVEYLYRRIITEDDDTVFKPVKISPNVDMKWEVESQGVHGLGRFPGIWCQNSEVLDSEDGDPDCHGVWQIFDTVDRLDSQANKGLLCNSDPTTVIRTDPKEVAQMGGSVRKGSENALYVGATGDAHYMEISAAGIQAASVYADKKIAQALKVVRCVMLDPEQMSGAAQSAKAMEFLYAPMLEAADDLRAQYGDILVVGLLELIDFMARAFDGKPTKALNEKGKEVDAVFQLNLPPRPDGTPRKLGPGGHIKITWGPYFAPTETDRQIEITNIVTAKEGGIIDEETAVNRGAQLFGIKDTKKLLETIRAQKKDELDMMGYGELPGKPKLPGQPVAPKPKEPATPQAGNGGKP
jgi:hypothetical protein